MKMKITNYFMALVFLLTVGMSAQESFSPTSTGMMNAPRYVQSIAEQIQNGTIKYSDNAPILGHPKGGMANNVIPGKGLPVSGTDVLSELQRNAPQNRVSPPILVFDADISQATPSDPTGVAGPNHYMGAWNSSFRIFDKQGTPLTAELSLATIFPGNSIGDPIVFYDAEADRFVLTEFDNSPNGFNVAVCQGSDPVNDGWHVYTTGFGTGSFPDYTKFSVWADTYMVTANIGASNRVFAVERNQMLDGNAAQFVALPLPSIATNGFYSPQAFHTTDDQLAPNGTPAPIVYLQDDAWGGVSADHLKVWSATIDWATPGNSSMSSAQVIPTVPFISVFDGGGFSNLSQPAGPDIDCLQATIMNQAQYRRFGTHNSAVFNFVIDTDAGGGELAGVRWYELRQTADGQPWTIYQEGTYVSPAGGKNAFNASMAMNGNGDIGMAYSTVSTSESIGVYYTGRLAGDPLNVMTSGESLIAQSTGNNPNLRYADYSQLSVDPADDASFWHITEYFNPNRRDVAANFSLAPPPPDDIGVTSIDAPNSGILTNAESITVTINNFGNNDITNPPVQYTIDGGTAVVESFSGTITAGTSESYTFTATADLSATGTYSIAAKTNLAGDTNPNNDETTKMVTNGVQYCMPTALLGCNLDGIKQFVLGSISADDGGIGCNTEPASSPTGYADRTNLSTDLDNQAGSNEYTLQARHNWPDGANVEALSVWIDFDDSGTFEASERLISGDFFTSFDVLEDFILTIPVNSPLGTHRLRAKAIDTSAGGDILDPCLDSDYGEVQDYTVNITGVLGLEDLAISQAELVVLTLDNNQFDISLVTSFDETASITIFNMLGQKLAFNNLRKEGDRYSYQLDMSYATTGIYLIKMGDQASNTYKTAKIIVK